MLTGWFGVTVAAFDGIGQGATTVTGVLFLITAATCWASGSVVYKRMPERISPWQVLYLQNLYGLPLVLLWALLGGPSIDGGAPLAAAAVTAGVVAGIGGFGLLFVLLRRGQASVVSTWIFAVPIISAALGTVVRHEALNPGLVGGGALVGVGIWLVTGAAAAPAVVGEPS